MPWLKDHIFAAVILAPVMRENALFRFHPLKERSARKRCQDVKSGVLDPGLFQEIKRLFKNIEGVVIKTKNDAGLDGDAVSMDAGDDLCVFLHPVEGLVRAIHACLRKGFKTDK